MVTTHGPPPHETGMSQSTKPIRRPQRNATKEGFANGYGNGYALQQEELPELPANRVNLSKMEVRAGQGASSRARDRSAPSKASAA